MLEEHEDKYNKLESKNMEYIEVINEHENELREKNNIIFKLKSEIDNYRLENIDEDFMERMNNEIRSVKNIISKKDRSERVALLFERKKKLIERRHRCKNNN